MGTDVSPKHILDNKLFVKLIVVILITFDSFYLSFTRTLFYRDMYPVFMRLLQFHLSATSASDVSSTFGHEHGAALMSLITQAMLVASAQIERLTIQKGNTSQRIPLTVTSEHLSGFAQPISLCLKKWLNQLIRAEEITVSVT